MTRGQRALVLGLAVMVAAGSVVPMIGRGAGSPPASEPATQAGSQARGQGEIVKDLRATSAALQEAMPISGVLDETVRKANASTAVPLLKKMASLLGEFRDTQQDPEAKSDLTTQQMEFYSFLVTFGDAETLALLTKQAAGKDAAAVQAQSALALGQWWKNSKNATEQAKILNDYTAVAKANPSDPGIVQTLGTMMQLGVANEDVSKKVVEVVKTTMKGEAAQSLLAEVQTAQAQHDMVGKPLTVSGRTTSGGKFTSEDLKGKVVLVDFWATWCGPCNAELPRTKKLYDDYHGKGLEIVGVDCDSEDGVVNAFTKEKQMPWTQLRESTQTGESQWHPLAKLWHVDGIPTMFLIDKKGVLRYIDAREGTDEKVAALLAEETAATQPAAK